MSRLFFPVFVLCFWLVACGGSERPKTAEAPPVTAGSPGSKVYATHCAVCHQAEGTGVPSIYPPLTQTAWTTGDEGRLIRLVLNGAVGEMIVNGEKYNSAMPAFYFLSDQEIADVLSFIRSNFGNSSPAVTAASVKAVRDANTQKGPWNSSVLEKTTGVPAAR